MKTFRVIFDPKVSIADFFLAKKICNIKKQKEFFFGTDEKGEKQQMPAAISCPLIAPLVAQGLPPLVAQNLAFP